MSIGAMDWAYRQSLPATEKSVLLALAYVHNGKTGQCNPTAQTLARLTGLGESTVRRSLTALEQAGKIIRNQSRGRHATGYILRVELAHSEPVADDQPSRSERVKATSTLPERASTLPERASTLPERDTEQERTRKEHGRGKNPKIPYQEIFQAFAEALPANPHHRKLTKTRQQLIKARWRDELHSVSKFRAFFEYVASSDFLTGRVNGSREPFSPGLDWLLKESNYVKVIEGNFHNGR
jgi:hypothetical protein